MEHTVQQGECLSSLAADFGLPSWKDLYNHPDNADLQTKRQNPNVLAPGDVVVIPDAAAEKKIVPCATGQNYLFVLQVPNVKLRVVLQNADDEPYQNKKFEVTVAGQTIPGWTDATGLLDIFIPATAQTGHLKVWFGDDPDDPAPDIDSDLDIGHLDPIDTTTGLQARLQNLGAHCDVNGDLDDATLAAARAFRAKAGLPEVEDDDALIDDDFRSRLLQTHDGE